MKIRHILFSVLALVFAISCTDEIKYELNEVKVSTSNIFFEQEGGNCEITVTATAAWEFTEIPEGITFTPASGEAGETVVTVTAAAATAKINAEVKLVCAGKTQYIIVRQAGVEYPEFKEGSYWIMFNVEGTWKVAKPCGCGIGDNSYAYIFADDALGSYEDGTLSSTATNVYTFTATKGGFYVTDSEGGSLYQEGSYNNFYREAKPSHTAWTVKQTGEAEFTINTNTSHIVCYSPGYSNMAAYASLGSNLLPLLVPAADPAPELLKFKSTTASIEKEGGELTIEAKVNAQTLKVVPSASWIRFTGSSATGLDFVIDANEGAGRSATVTVSATLDEYSAEETLTISQEGNIETVKVADLLAAEDNTSVFYRVQGRVNNVINIAKGRFDITDATGTIYAYNIRVAAETSSSIDLTELVADGDVVTIIGYKTSYSGTKEIVGYLEENNYSVTPITAAEFNALEDNNGNWYELTGTITDDSANTEVTKKFDLTTYGNFDLVDETGDVYVYGLSTGLNGVAREAASLNLAAGDKLTIVCQKGSYKSNPQATNAYFWKVEKGEQGGGEGGDEPAPTDNVVEMNMYSTEGTLNSEAQTLTFTSGDITVVLAKASSTTNIRNSDGDHLRCYQGSTLTVTSASRDIESVEYTATSAAYATVLGGLITGATVDNTVVTVSDINAKSVATAEATAQYRINKIKVTLK